MWQRLLVVLRPLVRGREVDRELEEELRLHVELEAAELERQGLSVAEAQRRARIALGGEDRYREEVRDVSRLTLLRDFHQDLRVAVRSLVQHASFAVAAVLTLAIALGAGTVILAVVDGVWLRPLPYAAADRLVMIWQQDRVSGTEREPASLPDYRDYGAARSFSGIAGFYEFPVSAAEAGGAERQQVAAVTSSVLSVLGLRPAAGRMFTAQEEGSDAHVALLSDGYARSRFGDASPLGRTVRFDGVDYTVIGVLPARTDFPTSRTAAWLPLTGGGMADLRGMHWVNAIARLHPDATLAGAQRELSALMQRLERQYPETNTARGSFIEPLGDALFGNVRPTLLLLSLSVIVLLLGACANVGNLLLARGAARTREVAVRRALGASTRRLLRQYLVEGLVLSAASALLGLMIAQVGLHWLVPQLPLDLPRAQHLALDARVAVGVLALVALLTAVFGGASLMQARATGVEAALRSDARRVAGGVRSRLLRRTLLVAQVALSTVLVIDATLLVRSFRALTAVDPGFETASVLKVEYQLPAVRYPVDLARWPQLSATQRFTRELLARVRELPGVRSAAVAAYSPTAAGNTNSFAIVGRERESLPEIRLRPVSDGYIETAGLELVAGRAFTPRDDATAAGVVLLNQSAARRFFPDQSPVGQRIALWGGEREIVGVIEDERMDGAALATPPAMYLPYAQSPFGNATLLLRVQGEAMALLPSVREVFRAVDPELALFGTETLESAVRADLARERLTALLLAAFAAVAFSIALIGVYGVLSYGVAQRRHELAVRLALGCSRPRMLELVLREGLAFTALGGAIGVIGALLSSQVIARLTFGVSATDGLTYAVTFLALALASTAAGALPAIRAGRTSPALPLRQ